MSPRLNKAPSPASTDTPSEKPSETTTDSKPDLSKDAVEVNKVPEPVKTNEIAKGPFINRTPAFWVLTEDAKGGLLTGINSRTNERFEGTRDEFNACLRGE